MTVPRSDRSGPPRWARRMLARSLPGGAAGESVLADLDEEFEDQRARRGARPARLWYAWESTKLAAHFWWSAREGGGRRGRPMDSNVTRHNIVVALRQFRRAPAFMATSIATMALGIGATVSIYSIVDSVLLDPLPYERPEELVAIWEWNVPRDRTENVANPGNFVAWRDGAESFASMTAVSLLQPTTLVADGRPDEVMAQYASPDFFEVLGLEASLGRAFAPDASGSAAPEVVLSSRFWRERFGARPEVVGRAVALNGTSMVVVGVLPDEYVVFGEGADLWVSARLDRGDQTNTGRYLMVLGRLRPDVPFEVAREELTAIAAGLQEQFPDFNSGWTVRPVPLRDEVVGEVSTVLWMLLGAVGLLLLIGCANVANLFLVRATARAREMAVRTSLGASSGTLLGQLLTESLSVAVVGAGLGIPAAHAATRWMATRMPEAFGLPRVEGAGVDGGVLLVAAGVTVATALLFGMLPALQAARVSPAGTLGAESRGASRRTRSARDGLVVTEMALSVVLLAGAALFARSFLALQAVDDGIESESVLVGRVNLGGASSTEYEGDAAKVAFFDELLTRFESSPDVVAAGGVTFLPMDGQGAATSYWPADRPSPEPEDRPVADIRNVAGDYFGVMGIDLLQGRVFDERDRADAPQTVVVSRVLAERWWPRESPIGKRVVVNWLDHEPWEIVGVVEDVRQVGPAVSPREAIYVHYAKETFFSFLQVTLRGRGDADELASVLRAEVAALDEALPLGDVRVMDEIVTRAVARPRMTGVLMLVFAALATLLAAVGLYGVLAYTVSRRVREIGVRIALGAEPGHVVRLVVAHGFRLVGIGLLVGLVATLVAGRAVASLLHGVRAADPLSLGLSTGVLTTVAVVACLLPAWKAARVPPAEALRPD